VFLADTPEIKNPIEIKTKKQLFNTMLFFYKYEITTNMSG
jgi:hypothetical protein